MSEEIKELRYDELGNIIGLDIPNYNRITADDPIDIRKAKQEAQIRQIYGNNAEEIAPVERNLIFNLNDPRHLINQDIYDSSPEYENGYVPYAVRRRMDLCEGEKFEIVNDVAVNLECARLRNYGNRRYAACRHIHDLLEYTFSKGTLITPDKIEDPDSIIRDGVIYNQARMGWECAKYYIRNAIVDMLQWCGDSEEVKHRIGLFVRWNDLENFILATLKLKHDPEIAEVFAKILAEMAIRNINLFSKDYVERMVTYVFIGSRYNELSHLPDNESILNTIHKAYGKHIAKLASGFAPHEVALIDVTKLETEDIRKYAYRMLVKGHDLMTYHGEDRFGGHLQTAKFLSKLEAEHNTGGFSNKEERRQSFAGLLVTQSGMEKFMKTINIPFERLQNYEEFVCSCGAKYKFVTFGLWLQYGYKNMHKLITPSMLSEFTIGHYYFEEAFYTAFMKFLNTPFRPVSEESQWIEKMLPVLVEKAVHRASTLPEDVGNTKHFYGAKIFMLFMMLAQHMKPKTRWQFQYIINAFGKAVHVFINNDKLRIFAVKMLEESELYGLPGMTDSKLEFLLDKNVPVNDVLKIASPAMNLEFLKKHHGVEYMELPQNILDSYRQNGFVINEHVMSFLKSVLTEEQMKSYPFNVATMRAYPDIFKPLVDAINIDRYIMAYGLNWVEENCAISISDIVNSESYVNEKVLYRYIDMILLDDQLRTTALGNNFVIRTILDTSVLEMVLSANNFPNSIKCEVFVKVIAYLNSYGTGIGRLKNLIDEFVPVILPGGGMSARALIGLLSANDIKKFDIYFLNPNLDV